MTSEWRILLRGIIDNQGEKKARPVIVTLDSENQVSSYEFLEGHEPHSTTFDPTHLLDINTLSLI